MLYSKENQVKIYGDIQSGNCYKIKLLTSLLEIEHEWIHIDILSGDTKTNEFLSKNPCGQIPLLELSDNRFLSESNAILNYLADSSPLIPNDAYERSKILQWQFFEQYSHEPYIAVARFISKYLGLPEEKKEEYKSKQIGGHNALKIMEEQLQKTPYIAGESLTIADISLYGYTHVAHEGGFNLKQYPSVLNWISQISSHPKYIGIV